MLLTSASFLTNDSQQINEKSGGIDKKTHLNDDIFV